MHRRISTILQRFRQDLAAPLGTDFLLATCLGEEEGSGTFVDLQEDRSNGS
jgi:hypothetical protein